MLTVFSLMNNWWVICRLVAPVPISRSTSHSRG
jgi:hypothetical protein